MKKLCLILTVLYAFGANCSAQSSLNISAQSSLNIAENLLTGDNSKFESSKGDWTCYDNYACSIASESGRNGNYLKLTNTGAGNDYEKQMEYRLSGHTPAKDKRYVIKFWAKRNGSDGSGKIKVLLQKNNESEKWPQKEFNDNPFTVSNDWTHYEFDITANRGDYQVIKINFGNCGEVWIDDIEYGEYSANVAPLFTTDLKNSFTVGQGGTLNLSVKASGTPAPTYQWYRNTTNSNENGTEIQNETSATYSVPTETKNTYYYYCVATNAAGSVASKVATVNVTDPTLSANGTYVENGMFYMLQDFGNDAVNNTWEIINHESHQVAEPGSAKIETDPKYGNVLHFKAGNNVSTEYLVFHCKLPEDKKLRDFSSFVFDYKAIGEDRHHKDIKFYWDGIDWNGKTYPTISTGYESLSSWHTSTIKLTEDIKTDGNEFDLYIGGIPTNKLELLITNIRLATDDSYTQNGKTIWSKVESETLYVTGSGPMPDFNGNQPWLEKNNSITKVIVSENITEIGNNAFKDLTKDNVVIILKSIQDRFGENCFSDGSHTRILQLELRDAEKPYISKTRALQNFPTFDKTTYFRNVTSNYSTVCLPFPVEERTVTEAGVELFDFTSIKKDGDQYTLAFTTHSGGMAAGQTYLIKKHDREVTLENTNVGKDQFILTPKESTITGSNPAFSISMKGVFQPSVFGPNLGTEQDPVYTYGFLNEKFYMNSGNMSVRPMRGYFYGSQLYSGQQQSGAKKMPKMFNFEIGPNIETHISSPDFIAEDFNIEEVYSPSGMKTESLNKGLNIIRTSTGRVLKVMVK